MGRKPVDHPLLEYFGGLGVGPLTAEQSAAASFDVRIGSIGRLLVREVLKLHRRLSPEGRASYSPEDILLEVWIELKQRDDRYDHARGRYSTFAARIMHHCFLAIIERARVVKLPNNSSGLFKHARPGHEPALARLSKAATDHSDVAPMLIPDRRLSPLDAMITGEDRIMEAGELADRLAGLTPTECLAVSSLGLWGGPKDTLGSIAEKHGLKPGELRKAMRTARAKLTMVENPGSEPDDEDEDGEDGAQCRF